MSLESKNFIANTADIETLARDHARAVIMQESSQLTYLRALVATAQSELGLKVRERTAPAKVGQVNQDQTSTIAKVHDRFYTVVLRVAAEQWPKDALERNRRTNYARSSYSTLRTWLLAGYDLASLAPGKVTKASLAVTRLNSAPKQSTLERKVDRGIESVRESLQSLAKMDQEAAITYAEKMLSEVTQILTEMGKTAIKEDVAKAAAERRPVVFRKSGGTFWPVAAEREAA